MERLERDLDQIYIVNKKLHVNVPRYRRNAEGAKRGAVKTGCNIQRRQEILQSFKQRPLPLRIRRKQKRCGR